MGGVSIWQLLIIAVIVVVLFGTNKLRTLGSDLGASIKGFKKAVMDDTTPSTHIDSNHHDADFTAKKIVGSPVQRQPEELKKNKEQV